MGGESLPGRQRVTSPASCSPPGSMGPGTQIAANWSAGWRARKRAPPQGGLLRRMRRSALQPLTFFRGSLSSQRGKEDEGLPGADLKNTGDDARLHAPAV
jgi:hypothetical protein